MKSCLLLSVAALVVFSQVESPAAPPVPLWVARYNGSGNRDDQAQAMTVDGSGQVYVTGGVFNQSLDMGTVKYDGNGQQVWAANYDHDRVSDQAHAIGLDTEGNVVVAGEVQGSSGRLLYEVIVYSASGTKLGGRGTEIGFGGLNQRNSAAYALTRDSNGNIVVTGQYCEFRFPYAPCYATTVGNGWRADYGTGPNVWSIGRAVVADNAGNVYIAGSLIGASGNLDYLTVKYSPTGVQLWDARFEGPGADEAVALAVNGAGEVYVTGRTTSFGSSADYLTIKYNASGLPQWSAHYDGPGQGSDEAVAIGLDSGGNVYVSGSSVNGNGDSDYATIKYDANGNQMWLARYNGPAGGNDSAAALVVDGANRIYVTGASAGPGSGQDYATVQYDSAGQEQWVVRYNGPANGDDLARALAVDSGGNVYVSGSSTGAGTGLDYLTIKYGAAGATIAPTITSPPQSQTALAGANTGFNVEATGSVPLSYQWFFNGVAISGATNPSLILNNVSVSQAGDYHVSVGNGAGSVNSAPVHLTIQSPPVITQQPLTQSVVAGQTLTLNVAATGRQPISYQWRFNGANVAGGHRHQPGVE